MGRYVISLNTRSALQETRAGGKGANLARLRRAGYQVPPGFIITSSAFDQFLRLCGIEGHAQGKRWSEKDLEQNRRLLMDQPIPPSLSHPISKAYQKLGGRVAVRSSMVGEDTVLASFAGQLETILNVQGVPELLEAVIQCWSSVFTWRIVKYIGERESLAAAPSEHYSMAVVVQRMIEAKAAGVAFSADPITGQRCVVIEAVHGLGQTLVQGKVKPDRYVVDTRGVLSLIDPVDSGAPALQKEQILQLTSGVQA